VKKKNHINIPFVIFLMLLCCGFIFVVNRAGTVQFFLSALTGTATVTVQQAGSSAATEELQIAQAVFKAINQDRASAGLAALQWNEALVRSARQHNLTMSKANQLSHQLPGEAELGTRETQQGITWQIAEENIGVTTEMDQNGALALHKAMMAEKPPDDGHRTNILNTQIKQLGVDILFDQTHDELWLTEDFAQII
jgi:uncharacterized protein YkwD